MKKFLISLLTLIFVISITISISAATTGSVAISLSSETVKAGDEFSIILKAEDLNYLNTVEYSGLTITNESGNVSTDITVKSVESVGNDWAKMSNEGKTNFVYSGEKTTSQDVFKITFKVEDSVTAGTYNINIEGIKVYSANLEDDTTDIGTKSISVKAIVDDTTADNKDEQNNNTQTPSNTSNSGNKSNTTKSNTSSNKNTKLPQTGVEMVSVIAIVALGAMGVASYISYRKYKNI